jgi:hypothetical protein
MDLVTVSNLVDRLKNTEKRELKLQDFYDNKFKNSRDREDAAAKERAANSSVINQTPDKPKPKEFNEETEILNVLSKIRQQKVKENEKDDRGNDNANAIVDSFINDYRTTPRRDDGLLGKRVEMDAKGPVLRENVAVTRKHLLFFLQNDPHFRKSRFLLQAFLKQ